MKMKRSWSSYPIKKNFKEINPRKIQSNYNNIETNKDNVTSSMRIIKEDNYKIFRHLKNQPKNKFQTKNIIRKKKDFQKIFFKNINEETTSLLDAIKIQSGINRFSNIAGTSKEIEKKNRMISAGTLMDIPTTKHTKRDTEKKSNLPSSINLKKRKRNFSSKFNFNKIEKEYDDNSNYANNMVNSYLMKYNSKNFNFFRNNDNLIDLSKTLNQGIYRGPLYNININLGTLINNDQITKENKENVKNNYEQDLYDFIQEKKNTNNFEKDNPEVLKNRSDFLIKFSKIGEQYKKLISFTDLFRANFRELYNSCVKSLIKYFDSFNNFLLNEMKIDEKNLENWMNILNYLFNFGFQASKIQKCFYDELHFLKNENTIMKQKLLSQEAELNTKSKEINQINKLIIKYDLNSKIKNGKKNDMYFNNIKNKFTNQESHYVLTIHRLNQEIQDLTESLSKNNFEYKNVEKLKEQLNNVGKKYEEKIDRLNRLNGQKSTNIQVLTQREANLYEQISQLENEITDLKNKETNEREKNVMLNAKIDNLNQINEKNKKIIESLKNNIINFNKKDIEENKSYKTAKIVLMSPT